MEVMIKESVTLILRILTTRGTKFANALEGTTARENTSKRLLSLNNGLFFFQWCPHYVSNNIFSRTVGCYPGK